MEWKDKCIAALYADKLFADELHYSRFRELMDCFYAYPFFTKGLCKCMFLAAWDEEHFCILLETLTDLSLGREKNTEEMTIKGEALAEETKMQDDAESIMYQFSSALLNDTPFHMPDMSVLPEYIRPVIRQGLKASELIDSI